jgi:hypothetical protein
MRSFVNFVWLSTALAACVRPPTGDSTRNQQPNSANVSRAIYITTNSAKNFVVAIPIGSNGMLSQGRMTDTGGAGSNSIDGSTNAPAAPDPLVGQAALTVAGSVRCALELLVDTRH